MRRIEMYLEHLLNNELILSPIIDSIGWTILHSVWQLGLLAVLLKVLLLLVAPEQAKLKYRLALFALMVAMALPVVTFCRVLPAHKERVASIDYRTIDSHAVAETATFEMYTPEELQGGWSAIEPKSWADMESRAQEHERRFKSGEPIAAQPSELLYLRQQEVDESGEWVSAQSIGTAWKSRLSFAAPTIAICWMLGVVLFLLRPAFGVWHISLLRRSAARSQLSLLLQKRTGELVARLQLRRAVSVVESAAVHVPTVIGFFKPMILVPASVVSGLSPQELDAILLHELAHLKRWDDVAAFFQSIVESLFFYHPGVWWISRVAHHERENCCDDVACELGESSSTLASALLKLARTHCRSSLALSATGGSLKLRIQRMLSSARGKNNSSYTPRNLFGSLLVLVLVGAISLTVYANVPEHPENSVVVNPAASGTSSKTSEPETKSAEPQYENQQPDKQQPEKQSDGISLSDAVKAFNKKHNRNALGNGIEFGGIEPQPLTVEEVEAALQRILDETDDAVPADLLEKIRDISQSKRLSKHFSISSIKGFTPNDFTKITAWRIMLSYNVPDDRATFRAFVIRDSGDPRNMAADAGEKESQLAAAIRAFNETYKDAAFTGVDPDPLTTEEILFGIKQIEARQKELDISDELMNKIRNIAETKQLSDGFRIEAQLGFTPNDFTKITGWQIHLAFQKDEDRESFRAFVIRVWEDPKNTGNTKATELAASVRAFNKSHEETQFTGINPEPLTVNEVIASINRLAEEQEAHEISDELMKKITSIVETERLGDEFRIDSFKGFSREKVATWSIGLNWLDSKGKPKRAFTIRNWGDPKNETGSRNLANRLETAESIHDEYQRLLALWQKERKQFASSSHTDDYWKGPYGQAIIALGPAIIPELINEIRNGDFWFNVPLARITGVDITNGQKMSEQEKSKLWLKWWDDSQADRNRKTER